MTVTADDANQVPGYCWRMEIESQDVNIGMYLMILPLAKCTNQPIRLTLPLLIPAVQLDVAACHILPIKQ